MKDGIKYALWFIIIMVFIRSCNACVGCTKEIDRTIKETDQKHQKTQENAQINLSAIGKAIDLGLPSGTLWADRNLGATKSDGYGEYFAWGETFGSKGGKKRFVWNTYKWCNGAPDLLTKYCDADGKRELEPKDDAATVNWGVGWQTPSKAQLEELRMECNWELKRSEENVIGYVVKSKRNSNWIFLPLSGYYNTSISNREEKIISLPTGYYWSKELETGWFSEVGDQHHPYCLIINTSETQISKGRVERCEGISIRPVRVQKAIEKGPEPEENNEDFENDEQEEEEIVNKSQVEESIMRSQKENILIVNQSQVEEQVMTPSKENSKIETPSKEEQKITPEEEYEQIMNEMSRIVK